MNFLDISTLPGILTWILLILLLLTIAETAAVKDAQRKEEVNKLKGELDNLVQECNTLNKIVAQQRYTITDLRNENRHLRKQTHSEDLLAASPGARFTYPACLARAANIADHPLPNPAPVPEAEDLSSYGAQLLEENGRKVLSYWPYCAKCHKPFEFEKEEPFASCGCPGSTEWGDPRPASWVQPPALWHWRCPDCKAEGESKRLLRVCPECKQPDKKDKS